MYLSSRNNVNRLAVSINQADVIPGLANKVWGEEKLNFGICGRLTATCWTGWRRLPKNTVFSIWTTSDFRPHPSSPSTLRDLKIVFIGLTNIFKWLLVLCCMLCKLTNFWMLAHPKAGQNTCFAIFRWFFFFLADFLFFSEKKEEKDWKMCF